jgi:hypothetical protein
METAMTETPKIPSVPHGTLRTQIMTEFRRAPDGLDPDDVYAYIVQLQARIDFLEGQLREISNAALLDTVLKQAVEIRRQALEAAERAWMDIVQAACAEAAHRREVAMRDARRLLDDTGAEIRGIHDRLLASTPADTPAAHHRSQPPDPVPLRATSVDRDRPGQPETVGRPTPIHQGSSVDATRLDGSEIEPLFRVPTWIEE